MRLTLLTTWAGANLIVHFFALVRPGTFCTRTAVSVALAQLVTVLLVVS
jgi:hypothetical protein